MWRIEQKHRYSIMWQKNIDTSSRDRQVHNKNPEYIVTQHKLQSRPNTKWPDTKSSDDAYVARTAHGAGKTQMNIRNFVRVTIKKMSTFIISIFLFISWQTILTQLSWKQQNQVSSTLYASSAALHRRQQKTANVCDGKRKKTTPNCRKNYKQYISVQYGRYKLEQLSVLMKPSSLMQLVAGIWRMSCD